MTDVQLDELDSRRDEFESLRPGCEDGGDVWARGAPLLFWREWDGFDGMEKHEADGFDGA